MTTCIHQTATTTCHIFPRKPGVARGCRLALKVYNTGIAALLTRHKWLGLSNTNQDGKPQLDLAENPTVPRVLVNNYYYYN